MKIPRPFAIAIDDLGWMFGKNEGYLGKGPYRVGVKRNMDLMDYKAVVDLAEKVGVRLQGLFILGELDREGVARSIPTILPTQTAWNDTNCDLQIEIMDLVKTHSSHLEFGLHGVGHEYWPDNSGFFKRAEWYNLVDKTPWPEESIRAHIDCFKSIMTQYDLTKSQGHSFPQSFVPCAYSYYWNPKPKDSEYSLGAIMKTYGIRYANTDFTQIAECNPPIDGGFDKGIHVMNRYNFGNLWHMIGQLPMIPIKYQTTDFIEVHWPNLLGQDTFLQEEVTQKWVDYYQEVNSHEDRYCSKNTAQHHSQFLYCKFAKLMIGESIIIDNTCMPTDNEHQNLLQNLVLKLPISKGEHLCDILLDGKGIAAYYESENFAYLFLPKLESRKYKLEYKKGTQLPKNIVWHDSTSSILSTQLIGDAIKVLGIFYGKQSLELLTDKKIQSIKSNNSQLEVESWKQKGTSVKLNFEATDFQGVTAEIYFSI